MASKESRRDSLRRRGSDGRVVDTEEVKPRVEHVLQPKRNTKNRVKTNEVVMTEDKDNASGMKSSFDRFGDDLSEVILSFLPIEDKFRLECLSKQWQRLVYNKQYVLRIDTKDKTFGQKLLGQRRRDKWLLKAKEFEKCLTKLKNLSDINIVSDIAITSQLLIAIGKKCQYLRTLAIDWNEGITKKSVEQFGRKCGPKLKSLSIYSFVEDIEVFRRLLSFTTELVEFNVGEFDYRLIDEKLLPKLNKIGFNTTDDESLVQLQDNYGHQLVGLTTLNWIEISPCGQKSVHRVIAGFSHCKQLHNLSLYLEISMLMEVEPDEEFEDEELEEYYYFDKLREKLNEMADNCQQLRRLTIGFQGLDSSVVLPLFERFTQLTQLCVSFENAMPKDLSLISLRPLSQLRRLTIHYNYLSDNHLEYIGLYLRRLKSLAIETNNQLSDKSFEYISELKELKTLSIECDLRNKGNEITSKGVKQLIECLPNITTFQLNQATYGHGELIRSTVCLPVTAQVIDSLKARAKQMPKIEFKFITNTKPLNARKTKDIPPNLSVHFNADSDSDTD